MKRGRVGGDVDRFDLVDRAAGLPAQGGIDGAADRARWQRVGEMDEILLEGRAMDAEDTPRGRVDAHDVVVRIDDDNADVEPEQDRLGRRGRVDRRRGVATRRIDGQAQAGRGFSGRVNHLRPRVRDRSMTGQPPVDPEPRVVLSIRPG